MCFRATREDTDELRRSRQRTFYKVVSVGRFSPERTLALSYKEGETVKAVRTPLVGGKMPRFVEVKGKAKRRTMQAGIYVFRKEQMANWERRQRRLGQDIVIKVRCEPRDLLGASFDKACYRKVKVLS